MKNLPVLVAGIVLLGPLKLAANEEDDPAAAREPPAPAVEFSRRGHLDVAAKSRTLGWRTPDPEAVASIEVRVVLVRDGAAEPEVLYRSDELAGEIDLESLQRGPGPYAILADTTDRSGAETKTGMRFSYTALNPDCPEDAAWQPSRRTVDYGAAKAASSDDEPGPSASSLLSLSRHASHVVTGTVAGLVTCPTKAGSLFTYVAFDEVQAIAREGKSEMPRRVVLKIPGGMAHGRVEIVTDVPVFRRGDRALLFLSRDPQSHLPIVAGVDGVFLVERDDTVRAYRGPGVVGITDDFTIRLDPGYRPNPEHLRHYDPNMRAVIVSPDPVAGITATPRKEPPASEPALTLKELAQKVEAAWAAADRMGRLPLRPNFDERPRYNALPEPAPQR